MYLKKIYNDKYRRKLFIKTELKFIALKGLLLIKNIDKIKELLKKQIFLYDSNSFLTKIRNMCIFTGRCNGVYRLFKISRIQLRREASENGIYGMQKSS